MSYSIKAKLLVVATALAAAGTGLSGAAHAQEVPVFSDVVAVGGCVSVTPGVPVMGGTGSFAGPIGCSLPIPTVCAIQSDPDITTDIELATPCSLSSITGSYNNTICGTGDATGSASIDAPGAGDDYSVNFAIRFVAGQGLFTGVATAAGEEPDTVTGVVDILPTAPLVPPCPVTQFRFSAVLALTD
jgi:hypothetical protein